jgi:hypothetical protein
MTDPQPPADWTISKTKWDLGGNIAIQAHHRRDPEDIVIRLYQGDTAVGGRLTNEALIGLHAVLSAALPVADRQAPKGATKKELRKLLRQSERERVTSALHGAQALRDVEARTTAYADAAEQNDVLTRMLEKARLERDYYLDWINSVRSALGDPKGQHGVDVNWRTQYQRLLGVITDIRMQLNLTNNLEGHVHLPADQPLNHDDVLGEILIEGGVPVPGFADEQK